jgi:hypothetical protein
LQNFFTTVRVVSWIDSFIAEKMIHETTRKTRTYDISTCGDAGTAAFNAVVTLPAPRPSLSLGPAKTGMLPRAAASIIVIKTFFIQTLLSA